MKYAATLVIVPHGSDTQVLAISPNDNVWFTPADLAPADMKELQRSIEADGSRTVLGHLTVADDYRPE